MQDVLDWNTTVSRIYRGAVADSGVDGIDRQVAYDTAVGRIRKLLDSGVLSLPLDKAIRAELDKADDRDSQRADNVIKKILGGAESLFTEDGDPILDLVVKLGQGRRKAWRDITAQDIADMTELRQANVRSVVVSFDAWRNDMAAALPIILAHGTIGAAVEAGAFHESEVAA